MRFLRRPYVYAALFSFLLAAVFVFTLLDAFVIPKAMQAVAQNDAPRLPFVSERMPEEAAAEIFLPDMADKANKEEAAESENESDPVIAAALNENGAPPSVLEQTPEAAANISPPDKTEDMEDVKEEAAEPASKAAPVVTADSYKDENIEISIEKTRLYNTDVYIADVRIVSIDYLKTAFARNIYGRNINERTSVIAERKAAILAINGDFYGFRDSGWVLRNGVVYRTGRNDTALLMDMAGGLSIGSDRASIEKRIPELRQIWSFGPPLVVNGAIAVTEHQEISGRSSISNPRTAIGQAGDLHYVFIVSDGRTGTSAGLSLYELAAAFRERGCAIAYNLDGGGSSAMYFNGRIVNRPTTGGNRIMEREVSDIVYIGY